MKRSVLLLSTLLIAGVLVSPAQQADSEQPPSYRGTYTHVGGVFVTPVAGAPFSATVEIKSEVSLPDGSVVTKHTINQIARDSSGRIRNERRSLVPESFQGNPMLLEVHIFDPETRLNTFYEPATRIARQRVLPTLPRSGHRSAKMEDLGVNTVQGYAAKGSRSTFTLPAQVSSTGKPVEVTDDYWYSEDLHIDLLIRHTDPRSGVQTVQLTSINRDEPPPALFEVPAGYKTVDVTPPDQESQGAVSQ
jgi:hypothetical protein